MTRSLLGTSATLTPRKIKARMTLTISERRAISSIELDNRYTLRRLGGRPADQRARLVCEIAAIRSPSRASDLALRSACEPTSGTGSGADMPGLVLIFLELRAEGGRNALGYSA
jgi:hypothetical protein